MVLGELAGVRGAIGEAAYDGHLKYGGKRSSCLFSEWDDCDRDVRDMACVQFNLFGRFGTSILLVSRFLPRGGKVFRECFSGEHAVFGVTSCSLLYFFK